MHPVQRLLNRLRGGQQLRNLRTLGGAQSQQQHLPGIQPLHKNPGGINRSLNQQQQNGPSICMANFILITNLIFSENISHILLKTDRTMNHPHIQLNQQFFRRQQQLHGQHANRR